MVELAGADPEIGLVGSYYVYGRMLLGDIDVQRTVIPGRDVRRDHLLSKEFYLGPPTTLLFRAKALSEMEPCFRSNLFFDDLELCFRLLGKWKFGFVHQILAFVRYDYDGAFSRIREFDFIPAYRYVLARQFGEEVFEPNELSQVIAQWKRIYLQSLGHAAIAGRSQEYWNFHKGVFSLVGERLGFCALAGPVARSLLDMLLNPKCTIERLLRRRKTRSNGADGNAAPHRSRRNRGTSQTISASSAYDQCK
jgi:hypothetical protein